MNAENLCGDLKYAPYIILIWLAFAFGAEIYFELLDFSKRL